MAMRGRVIVIAILAVAAIGISLWRPWRDAGPAPDVSAEEGAAAEPAAAAPPPRQEPPPEASPAPAPARAWPVTRLAARDAGPAALDVADDKNRARLRALHEAMVATTPEVARLYGAFARAHVPAPPEAKTLIEMKQRGVPQHVLVNFVNGTFQDLPARAIALRWLGVGAGAGARVRCHSRRTRQPAPSSAATAASPIRFPRPAKRGEG